MALNSLVRHGRLVSGLVPMAFVIGHLGNLCIGLVSLDAIEHWRARVHRSAWCCPVVRARPA